MDKERFLSAQTGYCNILLNGSVILPPILAPFYCSTPIIPLGKKCGGIRPIAVGEIDRRLVSKIACKAALPTAKAHFEPTQHGVGVEGGAEAIVHAINVLIDHLDTSSSEPVYVLKVDLKNAFNMVNRETFFEQVRLVCPSISSYIEFCYTDPALLFLADYILYSFTGVQQVIH